MAGSHTQHLLNNMSQQLVEQTGRSKGPNVSARILNTPPPAIVVCSRLSQELQVGSPREGSWEIVQEVSNSLETNATWTPNGRMCYPAFRPSHDFIWACLVEAVPFRLGVGKPKGQPNSAVLGVVRCLKRTQLRAAVWKSSLESC